MLSVYVLGFSHTDYVGNEQIEIYHWLKVSTTQVKEKMQSFVTKPALEMGDHVIISVLDKGPVTLRVMGNNQLRRLTPKEEDRLTVVRSDIVRLG